MSEQKKSDAEVLVPPAKQPPATGFVDHHLHLDQQVFKPRENDVATTLAIPTAEREALNNRFTDTIQPTGIESIEWRKTVYDNWIDAEIAKVHGSEDEDALTTRIQRENEEVRQTLADRHGREESEQLLARAARWVKTQPKLHALLGEHGLGSRPLIVLPIIDHVRRINWKG